MTLNLGVIRAVCEVGQGGLGPNAMHKLFSGTGSITTDGLTLLREMKFRSSQPIVNYLLRALESQDREAGDGTTRMLILIGALLESADQLIKKNLHPSRIAEGFREAASDTAVYLGSISRRVEGIDGLTAIVMTALAGKIIPATVSTHLLSRELAHEVVRISQMSGGGAAAKREALAIEPLDASLPGQQTIFSGVLLHAKRGHPRAPKKVNNAKVAIIDYPIDVFNKPNFASRIPHGKVESEASMAEYASFEKSRARQLESLVASIEASGANTVICKRGLGDLAMSMLADRGIFPVEKIGREADIRRLSLATGANLVANPGSLQREDLGWAAFVEEVTVPNGRIVLVDGGADSKAMTVFINGVGQQTRDASKRGIETAEGAICSAFDCRRAVAGGGAAEAAASRHLSSISLTFRSKKQLIYQGFAEALMSIPRNLAETTGLRQFDLVSSLGNSTNPHLGIDVVGKAVCDTYMKGIVDPLKVVSCYIANAADFAALILSVDILLAKPPEKEEADDRDHHQCKNFHSKDSKQRHPRYA
jgi:chaperonin GroEL (HSP60 family)